MDFSAEGGLKVCSNGHGLFYKMAALPMYGKNKKKQKERNLKISSGTKKLLRLNLYVYG